MPPEEFIGELKTSHGTFRIAFEADEAPFTEKVIPVNAVHVDLAAVGSEMSIKSAGGIIREIADVVSEWHAFARKAGVPGDMTGKIAKTLRLDLV